MSMLIGSNGVNAKLYPDADNWAAFKAVIDASTHIKVPAGVWPVSKCVNIKNHGTTIRGFGPEKTTIKNVGTSGGPVLGCGGNGGWQGSEGYTAVNNISIYGMTLWQTDNVNTNNVCFSTDGGENYIIERVRARGSSYEGFRGGGRYATIRNIEAWDCGNGGPAVDPVNRSTAGINLYFAHMLIDGFTCLRCGQGVESGYTNVTIRNGLITGKTGTSSPERGIGIGSSVVGNHNVVVENVTINDYHSGMEAAGGNNGRLSKIIFRNNKIICRTDGATAILFSGGAMNNVVVTEDQGPDLYGSEISGNDIQISGQTIQGAISYTATGADNNGLWGREPLVISGNTITFDLPDPSLQTSPLFGFGGKITAECLITRNRILGLPDAPVRGDVQSISNAPSGQAVPGIPNLQVYGNIAYDQSGQFRTIVVNREGA